MYKRIDLTKIGGFPVTQDVLDFLQKSYRDCFAGLAAQFGNLVIISGVADLGANWGDGWVVIGGELMPFVGGTKAARVIVQEDSANETFGDTLVKTVYYTKTARLAAAGGDAFTDFVRLRTARSLLSKTVPIGNWNMNITSGGGINSKTVDLGVPFEKIRRCEVLIVFGQEIFPLTAHFPGNGTYWVGIKGSTNIVLYAQASSFFDNPIFGGNEENRGFVTFDYEP